MTGQSKLQAQFNLVTGQRANYLKSYFSAISSLCVAINIDTSLMATFKDVPVLGTVHVDVMERKIDEYDEDSVTIFEQRVLYLEDTQLVGIKSLHNELKRIYNDATKARLKPVGELMRGIK